MWIQEYRAEFRANLARVILRDKYIYLIVLTGFLCTYLLNSYLNPDTSVNYFLYSNTILNATLNLSVLWLIGYFYYLALTRNPTPLKAYRDKFRLIRTHPHEVVAFLLLLVAVIVFKSSFTALKAMIPTIMPFAYDILFADLDRAVHFGIDPWRITHAVFDSPVATGLINLAYNGWFFVYWIVLMYFLLQFRFHQLRMQYLVSFMICWFLLGNVLAIVMSSAGPCYYGLVTGGMDTFASLMDRLSDQNTQLNEAGHWLDIWALGTQDRLWEYYITDTTGLGNGISAMPSMHVSVATLMALGVYRLNRWWGYIFWGYALMIQIGSVHLGWHYAIDGYLSIILTLIIWKLVGTFINGERLEEHI